jgi:hypothetical protein
MMPITLSGKTPIAENWPMTPMGHANMEVGHEWQFKTGKQTECHWNNPILKRAAKAS